ncbi:MAG: 2-succinyl-5-enolpyruvyl-6-hydroxy-3-cyclohexene-1-carboxylic-acid synthase [Crocinitomicaceae bacterium]
MQTTRFKHIAYLVELCVKNGIKEAVISPGSRNAPLIIALESHPQIKTHLIHDERVAAFFALGMADASASPVILTCTSGSALLNYAPAIAEAYYRQVPLLVLSADRPAELIDQGDGQTIRQSAVFRNFIKRSFDFPNHDAVNLFENSCEIAKQLVASVIHQPQGPVQLNIPLEEPLYEVADYTFQEVPELNVENSSSLKDEDLAPILNAWKTAEKKMIIVGQLHPDQKIAELLKNMAADPSVAVLVENTSNVQEFSSISHTIDRSLATIGEKDLQKFAPDLLLTLGGAVISKRIKGYLRKFKPQYNWRIGQFLIQSDTYQSATGFIDQDPEVVLSHILKAEIPPTSNYGGMWKQKDLLAQEVHEQFLSTTPLSDLKVFEVLFDCLPDDSNLHMGNSSVVRYCQLFNPIPGIHYFSNRGVSGIDGSSSTAAGFAQMNKLKLNTLITGDISFFYDSNAFWNRQKIDNLKVVVISNGGGAIFQIIPGPSSSAHANTFFAPTLAKVKGICDAYDVNYYSCSSLEKLEEGFTQLFQKEENERPSVLEIFTQDCNNAEILEAYFQALNRLQ